ncbi:MAG: hypothetical protein DRN07_06500, partial [Thermoplasmata archaeon]
MRGRYAPKPARRAKGGPLVPWREIGGALALGAAYLALELGWRLLKRRLRKLALPSRRSLLPEVAR